MGFANEPSQQKWQPVLVPAGVRKGPIRVCFQGGPFSGKTVSAQILAAGMTTVSHKRIAAIDTECGSMSKALRDTEQIIGAQIPMDVIDLNPPFEPEKFKSSIEYVYDNCLDSHSVLIIDSASHFWAGIRQFKDRLDSGGRGNGFVNWGPTNKVFEQIFHLIIYSPIDVIICLRAKEKFQIEKDNRGKQVPVSIGEQPDFRKDHNFEFDVVAKFERHTHLPEIEKDRSHVLRSGQLVCWQHGQMMKQWAMSGNQEQPRIDIGSTVSRGYDNQAPDELEKWLRQGGITFPELKKSCVQLGFSQDLVAEWYQISDIGQPERDWILQNKQSVIEGMRGGNHAAGA